MTNSNCAYIASPWFYFSVDYEGNPLPLQIKKDERGYVFIREVEKQKWEKFRWEAEALREGEEWVWMEDDNFFVEFGGHDLGNAILSYLNTYGVPFDVGSDLEEKAGQ